MPHLARPAATEIIPNAQLSSFMPSSVTLDPRDIRQIGRWGEALVAAYLSATLPDWTVKWMNEVAESNAAYDLHLVDANNSWRSSRFVEVKASRYATKNAFEISLGELEFFSKNGGASLNYDIYRVFNAGDPARAFVAVLRDPYRMLKEQKIQLCLAV
jgi:hypothetical protein